MADDNRVFHVEIITPDSIFYRGEATMIEFNTIVGKLGVYRQHIPLTTILAPGIVRIHKEGRENSGKLNSQNWQENASGKSGRHLSSESNGEILAAVHSGFAEILSDKVTLLAELAEWPEEIDKDRAEAAKMRAEERLAHKTEMTDVKRAEFALRKALVRIDIAK